MATKKILGSKNVLKKVFVFLVLSASFLSLNSQDAFAEVAGDQSKITSKLVKNVKEVEYDRYYKGDFYSDVGAYPEGMFLVVEKLIENDELIEYASFCNNYYGTPRDYVLEQRKSGKNVILEIEVQGALKVKEKYPDAMLIFVTPPDAHTLRDRLVGRGTECEKDIKARLRQATKEADCMSKYDYVVVNDDLERAVKELNQIISHRGEIKSNNTDFIEKIKEDLNRIFMEEE